MIELTHITKEYGKRKSLNDVTFTFEKGKVYGILGPNGSGKSTIMKMMAGLVYPSKGIVKVGEKKADRKIASNLAFLASEGMLYPSFKIDQMIDFFHSQYSDFSMEKAEELLVFMELDRHQKVSQLSKGQQGRLKLLLVLSRQTDVLLLDEPFMGLDPMVRDTIVKGLVSFIDYGKQTVIITTHEITEIEPVLEEAIVLEKGQIRAHCNVEEIREEQGLSILEWLKSTFKQEDVS
ncbi:ABC transporter ATP-binding protein [Domibacillus epiphyticus]|uniref:Spermidine/putrescine ABC transporter ATP-binding protein n=1 Tax=Domibacillus epiphyticus TaxID=1714355 RepID=A0A1V2A9U1_9BACI|nr:ABC transporter ATP-binding protein [Domibacillus epiphyticus]OMP67584.1 spermidine/putrescine ABC transporter ATP-binding protein [Domibacillus epiphyticus]